jgi:hypothetical protein
MGEPDLPPWAKRVRSSRGPRKWTPDQRQFGFPRIARFPQVGLGNARLDRILSPTLVIVVEVIMTAALAAVGVWLLVRGAPVAFMVIWLAVVLGSAVVTIRKQLQRRRITRIPQGADEDGR